MSRAIHRIAGMIEAACSFCNWTTSGRTWRPVRRRMAAHHASKHRNVKVVV